MTDAPSLVQATAQAAQSVAAGCPYMFGMAYVRGMADARLSAPGLDYGLDVACTSHIT